MTPFSHFKKEINIGESWKKFRAMLKENNDFKNSYSQPGKSHPINEKQVNNFFELQNLNHEK